MKTINPPPGHALIVTEDGSPTLFSESFQEACHSKAGARTETLLHYYEGCKIEEKIFKHDPLCILEVGFGLGTGLLTTLEKMPLKRGWHFISLEIDRNLLEWFKDQHKEHEIFKDLYWEENLLKLRSPFFELTVIQGDARLELPRYVKENSIQWHAIYQDAFSPKRNPSLWTKEWFSFLKEHSHEDVILSSYSASTSIRKALHETGWGVQKGHQFGEKRSSTRAYLNRSTDKDILTQLQNAPVEAFTDLNIKAFERRIE